MALFYFTAPDTVDGPELLRADSTMPITATTIFFSEYADPPFISEIPVSPLCLRKSEAVHVSMTT
jgi:hypothetical protein